MYFFKGIPTVQGGYDSIMVIVNLLTKVKHLIPMKTVFKSSDIARLFIEEIFKIHRLPKRILVIIVSSLGNTAML